MPDQVPKVRKRYRSLNALSSPILVKFRFGIALTMVADTLYAMLAHRLRGFEDRDPPKIHCSFVHARGIVEVRDGAVTVKYPRKAHNPLL